MWDSPKVKALAAIALPLLLAGCQTGAPKPPEYIEVEVVRYVAVPASLTEPCPTDAPRENTYAEAKRLALARLAIIVECANADKAKIRALSQ